MKTTLVAATLVGTSLACSGGCSVTICEHNNAQGWCETYGEGDHSGLGWYNDRASSVSVSAGCKAQYFEHSNFGGHSMTHSSDGNGVYLNLNSGAFPRNMNDMISSIKVRSSRRRRADDEQFVGFAARDPLCEWILQDGLDGDWGFGSSKAEKDAEVKYLLEECDEEFKDSDMLRDQCKFYVYAAAAFYDDAELVEDLKFDPTEETGETEYIRCGIVANKINNAIEAGKLSGIKLVKGTDGQHDEFFLDDHVITDHPVYVENGGIISSLLSVGAMLSLAVGNTMVKVCRDFHPIDNHFLLA